MPSEILHKGFIPDIAVFEVPESTRPQDYLLVAYAPPVAGFDENDNPICGADLVLKAWNSFTPGCLLVLPSVFDANGNRLFDIKSVPLRALAIGERREIDGKQCLVLPLEVSK